MTIETIFLKYIKLREKLDNGKIYKLIDNSSDNVYIGSTCRSLEERLSEHKRGYKRFLKGLLRNVKSFDIIKNNDYKIELLEKCKIKTKEELHERERFFIQNNECLNKVVPGRTKEEYYIDNKDKIKEYRDTNKDKINKDHKEYNNKNKDKISEKFDCPCGGNFTYTHKSTHIKTAKHQNFLQSLNK